LLITLTYIAASLFDGLPWVTPHKNPYSIVPSRKKGPNKTPGPRAKVLNFKCLLAGYFSLESQGYFLYFLIYKYCNGLSKEPSAQRWAL
jgi:hypothetical protein